MKKLFIAAMSCIVTLVIALTIVQNYFTTDIPSEFDTQINDHHEMIVNQEDECVPPLGDIELQSPDGPDNPDNDPMVESDHT